MSSVDFLIASSANEFNCLGSTIIAVLAGTGDCNTGHESKVKPAVMRVAGDQVVKFLQVRRGLLDCRVPQILQLQCRLHYNYSDVY